MKIILIEDEETLNYALKMFLENEGFNVTSFYDIQSFLAHKNNLQDINLIIADISLPDGNFLEEIKKHPEITKKTKVFIISGQTEIENIKKSFNLGAEDFIKKPFDYEEILLRINKIFNHKEKQISDNVFYDYDSKSIIKNNKKITLTKKEALLLELFLKNKGKLLDSETIMYEIWGDIVEKNTLVVLIKRLREKLGEKNLIISKRDLGYIMN